MKKVLMIIIDALATRIVGPALQNGALPNFRRLTDAGRWEPECISIFPSITPAATCSLATGCYPFEHGISGAYWYDTDTDHVAYFGDDVLAIFNEGVDRYINDFQVKLNLERLQVPTVFERIEEQGLRDSVVNFMWYRGTVEDETSTPLLLKLAPGLSFVESMRGPHLMYMADFVATEIDGKRPSARGGMLRRFGFHDDSTADYLLELAWQNSLPDFTLAYFPNNDFDSHSQGPENALDTLKAVDEHLGQLFELRGGLENMLAEYAILITGDHSQSDLDHDPGVDLDEVLSGFELVEAGEPWRDSEDMMVCPNLRAAQIYLRPSLWNRRQDVIEALLKSDAIDQVIYCDEEAGLKTTKTASFYVETSDRGRLVFQAASEKDAKGRDDYGMPWTWSGDLSALDLSVTSKGQIQSGEYPNAFERIATTFFEQTGHLWITARLGKEFHLPKTGCNKGGSHGTLHRQDSTPPLIAAGLPEGFELPAHPRTVDVPLLCLELLGIDPPRQPGASHVR